MPPPESDRVVAETHQPDHIPRVLIRRAAHPDVRAGNLDLTGHRLDIVRETIDHGIGKLFAHAGERPLVVVGTQYSEMPHRLRIPRIIASPKMNRNRRA